MPRRMPSLRGELMDARWCSEAAGHRHMHRAPSRARGRPRAPGRDDGRGRDELDHRGGAPLRGREVRRPREESGAGRGVPRHAPDRGPGRPRGPGLRRGEGAPGASRRAPRRRRSPHRGHRCGTRSDSGDGQPSALRASPGRGNGGLDSRMTTPARPAAPTEWPKGDSTSRGERGRPMSADRSVSQYLGRGVGALACARRGGCRRRGPTHSPREVSAH